MYKFKTQIKYKDFNDMYLEVTTCNQNEKEGTGFNEVHKVYNIRNLSHAKDTINNIIKNNLFYASDTVLRFVEVCVGNKDLCHELMDYYKGKIFDGCSIVVILARD